MTAFTHQDVADLAEARTRIKNLEQFILDRAVIHARVTDAKRHPTKTRYNQLRVVEHDLFNLDEENIRIQQLGTSQYDHWETIYTLPREFAFGEPGEQEKKWETYLALKAELEPDLGQKPVTTPGTAQPVIVPRKKVTGIVRKQADVTGCYWECYGIYCDKDTQPGDTFCKNHKNQKCRMCGKPATHGCNTELQFVCGEPLCPDHQAGRH